VRAECPNPQPDCKYFASASGCFSDTHHIYGRPNNGKAKQFANLPDSKEQLCRQEHEEKHASNGVLPLPSMEVMKQAIARHKNGS